MTIKRQLSRVQQLDCPEPLFLQVTAWPGATRYAPTFTQSPLPKYLCPATSNNAREEECDYVGIRITVRVRAHPPQQVASLTSPRPVGHGPVRAYDWIAHHARQRPHKEAIRDLGSDRSFSYTELDCRIDATSAYLASIGIGRGDRVGVLAHNGVEYFDIQFACARRGAICVLLNWRLTVTELEYIINDSSPMLLVHDASFAETAEELQRRCSIGELLAIDGGTSESPYEQALTRFDGQDGGQAEVTHDDVITIMYTSGTTGLPKGP